MPSPSLRDLLELEHRDLRLNERSYAKNFLSQIKPVLRLLGWRQAVEVTYVRLEEYKEKRLEEGAARATINHELEAIRRAFVLGVDAELIEKRPKVRLLPCHNARQGFVEPEEARDIFAALPRDVRNYVEFGYYTGWRRGEIRKLLWDDVGEDFVYCRPKNNKTRRPKKAPLRGRVKYVIEERRALRAYVRDGVTHLADHVFHRKGRPIWNFAKPWGVAVGTVGRPDLRFHDFRRSFVRNAVRAGVHERIAMELSGHLTRQVFDRYNIVSESDLQDAVDKLERYCV